MPQLQGKQIANGTIEQKHLNLTTPNNTDLYSGATVEYVNSLTGNTIIGPPEYGTGYTNGLFNDFTEYTRIGVAVDRFNEILLLLAPTPPSEFITASLNLTSTSYTMRELVTQTLRTVTNVLTPVFTVSVPSNGLKGSTEGILYFKVDSDIKESYDVSLSNSKTTGVIRYTSGDPYVGQVGKAGFWSGFTSLSAISLSLVPSSSLKLAEYTHSINGTISKTFYLDDPLPVSIGTIFATVPAMTNKISGIPALIAGQNITINSFSINNVSSYFYSQYPVWEVAANLVNTISGDPDTVPSTYGETGTVTNKIVTVQSNKFSDTFTLSIRGRNSIGTYGSYQIYTNSTKRVDSISDETIRKTSGSGSYPLSGYGYTFDSNQSLLVGSYTNEMMLKGGIYQYPDGDYTTYGGPNYTSASGTRWVTFIIGVFSNNSSFRLNINGSSGISDIIQSGLLVEIKISGITGTYWVNGNSAYPGVGNPGSSSDGDASVVVGNSTPTSRKITFGSIVYTGNIVVRIGITNNSITLTSVTASDIV